MESGSCSAVLQRLAALWVVSGIGGALAQAQPGKAPVG